MAAPTHWHEQSLAYQLGNIGAEVQRIFHWQKQQMNSQADRSLNRALELLTRTIEDPRWRGKERELTRLREVLLDAATGSTLFSVSPRELAAYFLPYALRSRTQKIQP